MRPLHRRCLLEGAVYVGTEYAALRWLADVGVESSGNLLVAHWQGCHVQLIDTVCKAIGLRV